MNISLTVSTQHEQNGETTKEEFTVPGTLINAGGVTKLRYREPGEGMEKVITTVCIYPCEVQIRRAGAAPMVFISGKRTLCDYPTEYGTLKLGISSSLVRSAIGEESGLVRLKYLLDVDGKPTSQVTCRLSYTVTQDHQ